MPGLVALDLKPGPAFVDALQRIWDDGDAVCIIDQRLAPLARQAQLAALAPVAVIGPDEQRTTLPGGRDVEAGDALVMATSGSSGEPKGVILGHDALMASAQATSKRLGVDPDRHTWLACLPLAHIGGFSVVTRALLTETPLVMAEGFDADVVEALGREGHVTHVSLVATALGRLNPGVFTKIVLGGAAAPSRVPGNTVVTYGLTETGSGVVYDGRPLEGVELAFDDGEILVRGAMLARAYRDGTPTLGPGPDGTGGWLRTGDHGSMQQGKLVVSGRIAEAIKTGGELVWPNAVELILAAHPRVAEVAVWKRNDREWGERVVAFVVPTNSANPPVLGELQSMVRDQLAPFAAPKELVLMARLPRSPSGKVLRREL